MVGYPDTTPLPYAKPMPLRVEQKLAVTFHASDQRGNGLHLFAPKTGHCSGGFVEELNLGELFAFCLGKIVIALYLEP